jgi:Tol biopolymer transport system component
VQLRDVRQSRQERLTSDQTGFSDWSPDGSRIAFDFVNDTGVHIATMTSGRGRGRGPGRHCREVHVNLPSWGANWSG